MCWHGIQSCIASLCRKTHQTIKSTRSDASNSSALRAVNNAAQASLQKKQEVYVEAALTISPNFASTRCFSVGDEMAPLNLAEAEDESAPSFEKVETAALATLGVQAEDAAGLVILSQRAKGAAETISKQFTASFNTLQSTNPDANIERLLVRVKTALENYGGNGVVYQIFTDILNPDSTSTWNKAIACIEQDVSQNPNNPSAAYHVSFLAFVNQTLMPLLQDIRKNA